jgi:acyl-CoA dehydrogenase
VPRDALIVGLGWCGPAVMALGSDAQRDRFLPPLLRGDEVWCQLFSEPSAGSDLAGLETSAVRDGDEWVITGQKAWTTFAHRADWGLCIARHDSSASKHRGLTAFLVDMHDDRVTASPIRQMTGSANFNVVHLDEVRVPDAQRIGEVGGGWQMVVTTFMFERSAGLLGLGDSIDVLVELARRTGRASDEHVRDRLATLHARARVVTWAFQRSVAALAPGRVPGPEGSIAKLSATLLLSDVYEMGISLLGAGGMMTGSDARDDGEWQAAFLGAPGLRIGGGTDAVQRTIIGDRILGLPAEPRPDKSRPFSEVVNRLGISRGPGV